MLIRKSKIRLAGNLNLRIYGQLGCKSGLKMKKANRVFFVTEGEAIRKGFRPCGHCFRHAYKEWTTGYIDHNVERESLL